MEPWNNTRNTALVTKQTTYIKKHYQNNTKTNVEISVVNSSTTKYRGPHVELSFLVRGSPASPGALKEQQNTKKLWLSDDIFLPLRINHPNVGKYTSSSHGCVTDRAATRSFMMRKVESPSRKTTRAERPIAWNATNEPKVGGWHRLEGYKLSCHFFPFMFFGGFRKFLTLIFNYWLMNSVDIRHA